MISLWRNSNLVLVRHKKNGALEARHAGDFSTSLKMPATSLPWHLHFTNEDHMRVCRCPHSKRHKKSSPVASESKYLAANLIRYLDSLKLEACSIADFHANEIQERAKAAYEGIAVDRFHYSNKQKDVVCRCTGPDNHGRGAVRNREIVERCVEYFRRNINMMICTKTQWREVEVPSPKSSSSVSDSFKYNSTSTHDLLHERERLNYDSAPLTPHPDLMHLCNGCNGESDVPERIWESARPSMWDVRRGSATSCSTPLGTALSPKFPVVSGLGILRIGRPASIKSPQRTSIATVWSDVQRDAASQAPRPYLPDLEQPLTARRLNTTIVPVEVPNRTVVELRDSMPTSSQAKTIADIPGTTRVKLPTPQIPAELPPSAPQEYVELSGSAPRPMSMHSATLRELKGKDSCGSTHKTGKKSLQLPRHSEMLTFEPEQVSGRTFPISRNLDDVLGLPDQEVFPIRHVTVCSRAHPPPPRDCRLCRTSLYERWQRTVQIDSRQYFVHETCLVNDFRLYDETFDKCPICDMALCKRGLMDRIALDREAIFGSQRSTLPKHAQIEFPKRGTALHLQYEEELAAPQLRLLKGDHTDDTSVQNVLGTLTKRCKETGLRASLHRLRCMCRICIEEMYIGCQRDRGSSAAGRKAFVEKLLMTSPTIVSSAIRSKTGLKRKNSHIHDRANTKFIGSVIKLMSHHSSKRYDA